MNAPEAALDYTHRGWHVIPTRNKVPLTPHGLKDGTTNLETITEWWRMWPDAVPALVTGKCSDLAVLDVDVDTNKGVSGLDSLDALGIATHPITPTAHTPRGGIHMLFKHPGYEVRNSAGKIGLGIDVRGDGGYIVAPPEPGRYWDPHLGPNTSSAPMPDWMIAHEPAPMPASFERPRPSVRLSRYCETALDNAVKAIVSAPSGAQQETLNREVFSIGRLAGGGAITPGLALEALIWAARQMPTYNAREPWRPLELDRIVNRSFSEGLRQPRGIPR